MTDQGERDRLTWEASLRKRRAAARSNKAPTLRKWERNGIGDAMGLLVAPLHKQIAELKKQNAEQQKEIDELKQRPQLQHCGVWAQGKTYSPGMMTTHDGALWIALSSTNQRPGTDDSGFRLIEKSRRTTQTGVRPNTVVHRRP